MWKSEKSFCSPSAGRSAGAPVAVDAREEHQAGRPQRPQPLRRRHPVAVLEHVGAVRAGDEPHQPAVPAAALGGLALQQVDQQREGGLEAALQRLRLLLLEPLEGLPVEVDVALGGRLLLDHLLAGLLLLGQPLVLDHVLGGLRHHVAPVVEPLAPGPARDLVEVAGRQHHRLLAVELAELGEDHGADGDVDAHPQGVGAGHHLEQPLLRQLLGEQPVLGQQAGVVQPDAVAQEALQLLAVGRVEADALERQPASPPSPPSTRRWRSSGSGPARRRPAA